MTLLHPPYGLIKREKDEQTLRTKIVATIGKLGPKPSYGKWIYDDNNQKIFTSDLDYDYLVGQFYSKGVDIIRVNLSHLEVSDKVNEIKEVFPQIKSAILRCEAESERTNQYRKRIAILADLPGPKIRFHLPKDEGVSFEEGATFTIHFREEIRRDEVSKRNAATVYIDEHPLQETLEKSDDESRKRSRAISDVQNQDILQNGFGIVKPPIGGSFKTMMESIRGRLIFVGDGEVVMRVINVNSSSSSCDCEVMVAKQPTVTGDKGFTLKGVDFNVPAFTEADKRKLEALIDADYEGYGESEWESVVGFIGLSFTQTAYDVMKVRRHAEYHLINQGVPKENARLESPSIIAKIETKMGWENRRFILDVADGVMVARGDLGLQMEIAEIPHIQKNLIQLCNKRGKPVITATEMLKSMTQSFEPTRAEGADVFNAILDGSDAVMTSEETASGKYPFHSISKAIEIASEAELHFEKELDTEDRSEEVRRKRYDDFLSDDSKRIEANQTRFRAFRNVFEDQQDETQPGIIRYRDQQFLETLRWRRDLYHEKWKKAREQKTTNCITQATCTMSESDHVEAILAATTSGRTVRMISRLRPNVDIIGAAHDRINTRKLALSYGVIPICIGEADRDAGTDGIFNKAEEEITRSQYFAHLHNEVVVFTAGTELGKPGTTNSIQMRQIGDGGATQD